MWVRSSLITRRCGAEVKVASKDSMGRDPLRQLPGKWSSDIVCTARDAKISQVFREGMGAVLTILKVHLDCWPIGGLAHPYVEVLALPCFEEEHVVAIVKFCELIELVKLCLCV